MIKRNLKKVLTQLLILYILYIYSRKGVRILDIIISNSSNQPIYDQIYSQIKNLIISGKLKEGESLPSIRSLAKDLRISVITTKRAYDELERDGFIYTVAGKGCFVAEKNVELIREENLKRIEEYMMKIAELAAMCDISIDEIVEMFRILFKEEGSS
jgi:GntR family transcriptional regulator